MTGIVIESPVEYPDIPDVVLLNQGDSPSDGFNGKGAYGFLASAYTKGACIEASACSFQLHERFAPIEERAFFGRDKPVEMHHLCTSVIVVGGNCIQIT